MRHRALFSIFLVAALVRQLGATGLAEQTYAVAGRDSFSIGENDVASEVTYKGTQTLAIHRNGHATRYDARVRYERSDGTATTQATGQFVSDVSAAGRPVDEADRDPDYLTVLNQPFAASLDPQTLADLGTLHGPVPFDFPSPYSGSSLHGFLTSVPRGTLGGRRAIGVAFAAAGPMRGGVPDRPGLSLRGTIKMRGTAYYDARTALLLALTTTVTISGNVSNRAGKNPVVIRFERRIRSSGD